MTVPRSLRFYRSDSLSEYQITPIDIHHCGFNVLTDCPWFPYTAVVQVEGYWLHFRVWAMVNGNPHPYAECEEVVAQYWERINRDAADFHEKWREQHFRISTYDYATKKWIDKFMTQGNIESSDFEPECQQLYCDDASKTFGEISTDDSY